MSPQVIAIDGPAASGKSSVARGLANHLGLNYLNTGAMYRAITWHILNTGADPHHEDEVTRSALAATIATGFENGQSYLEIDGFRPTSQLRDETVNRAVSAVSTVGAVRSRLMSEFHRLAAMQDCVVEGRDIGSVVFPDTIFKFYLDAAPEVRQRRRSADGETDEVSTRDRIDSSRNTAPLRIAPDAIVIDTTHLDLEETIDAVRQELTARGFAPLPAR